MPAVTPHSNSPAATLLLMLICSLVMFTISCRKEVNQLKPAATVTATPQKDALLPVTVLRNPNKENSNARFSIGQIIGNYLKHSIPTTMMLDFDGATNLSGTPWGIAGTFSVPGANFTADQIQRVKNQMANYFWNFNVTVTTDESLYDRATGWKQRLIFTNRNAATNQSPAFNASAAIIVTGSMLQGIDGLPGYVFTDSYGGNLLWIARDATHLGIAAYSIDDDNELDPSGPCGLLNLNGSYFLKFCGGGTDGLKYGDLAGNSRQSTFARFCIGQSAVLPCGANSNSAADSIIARSGWRIDIVNSLDPVVPLQLAAKMDLGLMKISDRQYLLKGDASTKTLTFTSGGSVELFINVYPGTSKSGTPVLYHNGSITESFQLSGAHLIEVYTQNPTDYEPSSVGGNYRVTVSNH